MRCFICRTRAEAHVIRGLKSASGPAGWARVCVACAIAHDLDGILLAPPHAAETANRWREHRRHRRDDS